MAVKMAQKITKSNCEVDEKEVEKFISGADGCKKYSRNAGKSKRKNILLNVPVDVLNQIEKLRGNMLPIPSRNSFIIQSLEKFLSENGFNKS